MMEGIAFGLDIGTTKICALVGQISAGDLQIIGVGVEPSIGIKKGMIIDVMATSQAIARAIEKAEHTSGYNLSRTFLNVSGEHISSSINSGAVAINDKNAGVSADDVDRALDAAQAIPIPHNRQLLHVVPRTYTVDTQSDVISPLGMHGFRLEVEAHIVTAATPAILNMSKCSDSVGLKVEEYVVSGLASAEAVLNPAEKDMGVCVIDIGGGTTDIALYSGGSAWLSKTLPIGGNHITNDIAIGLRVPFEIAEAVKMKYGDCRPSQIPPSTTFTVEPFGGEKIQVGHQDLAQVVEARVDEMFQFVSQTIKDSGFSGLLPAGIVLTGGGSQMKGMADVASKVMGIPARVAPPRNLKGLVDSLHSPEFSTSVGLLRWAMSDHYVYRPSINRRTELGSKLSTFFRSLLPD